MRDKRMTADEVAAELSDGMTVGIGGWGSRRKPMALVRAILRSPLRELTVVSYGGPDVGLLCAAGKVRRVVCGLRAAGHRLPFLPIRAGLGSDVLRVNPELRTVRSPYDGEELVAMPALRLDAALVHLNRADLHGNAQYLGPDPYFDDLFCLAAKRRFVSCERVVDTAELTAAGPVQSLLLNRMMVDGVVESPGGARFTSCVPDYGRDEALQRRYAEAAADDEAWPAFLDKWITT
jgi:glutaconate CoA-transferase subunit A